MFLYNKFKNRQREDTEQTSGGYLSKMDHKAIKKAPSTKKKPNPFSSDDDSILSNESNETVKMEKKLYATKWYRAKSNISIESNKESDDENGDDDEEFDLEEIDRILDPETYERKKHTGDAKSNLLMAKNSLEKYLDKDLAAKNKNPAAKKKVKPPKKGHAVKSKEWLDAKNNELDEIDKDIALLNFIKTTQEKVRNMTLKTNEELGYDLLSSDTSSNSTSPELEDSEFIETSSKVSFPMSFYRPKQSIASNPNMKISFSNKSKESDPIHSNTRWLDGLAFDKLMEQKCPEDASLTNVEEFRSSPLNEEEREEIERCTSPCKGKRKTLGWFKPDKSLMLARESDPDLEIEGPPSTDSLDDLWNS